MMRIVYHHRFLQSSRRLSSAHQRKLATLVERLTENPFHPLLHTTRLTGDLSGFLSFRTTRDWRVIFQFTDADTIQLLRTVHRRDAYR